MWKGSFYFLGLGNMYMKNNKKQTASVSQNGVPFMRDETRTSNIESMMRETESE